MTRTVLVLLAAVAPVSTARADDDDWTGQWVFPRAESIPLRDPEGNVLLDWISTPGRVLRVEKEDLVVRHTQPPGPFEGLVKTTRKRQ